MDRLAQKFGILGGVNATQCFGDQTDSSIGMQVWAVLGDAHPFGHVVRGQVLASLFHKELRYCLEDGPPTAIVGPAH